MRTALPHFARENTAALMGAATGLTYTPEQIQEVGERINNLARAFNAREGFGRAEDTLPERVLTEPLQSGASKGHLVRKQDLKEMLDEYYGARDWDVDTGIPTRKKLAELGLDYAADHLGL